MLVIGLTGNIGSGKSSIARFLKDMGAEVIDTDQVARDVVAQGTPGLKKIVEQFGDSILDADGNLNRPLMAQIVFNDPAALAKLNAIVHPEIRSKVNSYIERYKKYKKSPLLVIEAPLLIETGMYKIVDRVWLVTVDPQTQIQRVIKRDNTTQEQARKRINAQMPQKNKIPYADRIIDNGCTPEETLKQVRQIWSDDIERPQTQA